MLDPSPSPDAAACKNSFRSLPAENAPGPPAITMHRTFVWLLALSSASVMASYIDAVNAFFLSKRLIRTVRIGPASATVTRSVMVCQLKLAERGLGGVDAVGAFGDRAFQPGRLHRDVLGKEAG